MASIAQALSLLGVPLPKLRAETAVVDLQEWKDGPLREAWRTLAKTHHPDRAPAEKREEATKRFAELSDAHDRLRSLDVTITPRDVNAAAGSAEAEATVDDGSPKSYTDARGRVHTTYTDAQGRTHTQVNSGGSGGGGGHGYGRAGFSIGGAGFVNMISVVVGPQAAPAAPRPAGFTPVGRGGGRTFVG